MAKIVFSELEKWEEEYVRNALLGLDVLFISEKLDEKNVSNFSEAEILSPFIYSALNKGILGSLPNLKFIATRSAGFDHIDLDFCKEKGISIANVPSYGENTVAEHTFALILTLSRKIIQSVERTRRGDFSLDNLTGFDLFGKTIGVLGAGHIGKTVIKIARCFGMKVLVFTRTKDQNLEKDENISFVSLETLLGNSDIVSLHLPHTKETEHIINMKNIEKLKKGSILINTARGALVETQAILEGLDRGILSGVGLDVLEEECGLKEERELLSREFLKSCDIKTQLLNHVILTRNDAVVTPHNAFNSKEALAQILETTISNIKAFSEGKPQNLVF